MHTLPSANSAFVPEEFSENNTISDNYHSIDDGKEMDISDHSPVFCTFNLILNEKTATRSNSKDSSVPGNCVSLGRRSSKSKDKKSEKAGCCLDLRVRHEE